ncbi:30S ribosomal protein S4 [candidate division WWE3 bacterium CG_4_10_14_0_2_um_filter_42_7]|uniref:Small ribosomal subunit protein uS4 n=2 Tax=Katanobacteria TaxID=422282 RepID=A0A2H0X8U8_UNCKA|nr:MAG: 30S ribosomal protein S4 [candidate division WWE3 bacterium CG08_land_8_20_14_0_20_41_15]PIZ43831.1 MAG: 30S ribosomal protein S4 [candidate division WWE3 bacterium CG_4_10_14_0_2_um_filter_42_7]
MSRYTGPKCRLCRREGAKLFIKGARCETEKCAFFRRPTTPGHTQSRGQLSGYGKHLREKQKIKRTYGIMERQFRNYVIAARKLKGDTGKFLLRLLETRLDNVINRLGLAFSRAHARQLIRSGKFMVNGVKVTIPSYAVAEGDIIKPEEKTIVLKEISSKWLAWDEKKKEAKVLRFPEREDIDPEINEGLIVEFYSR